MELCFLIDHEKQLIIDDMHFLALFLQIEVLRFLHQRSYARLRLRNLINALFFGKPRWALNRSLAPSFWILIIVLV